MRICSLVPAGTDIIVALGLQDCLVGVTYECTVKKPVVVRCLVDQDRHSSREIDRRVRQAFASNHSLYAVDVTRILRLQPDVILAQDLCHVCAVTPRHLETLGGLRARIVRLHPHTLADVLQDIQRVADAAGVRERGRALVQSLRTRIEAVRNAVRTLPRRRVACIEWLDPVFCAGHWVPEMVRIAGGLDVLARPGRPARAVPWHTLRRTRPEKLILMPCGFRIERTLRELDVNKWKRLCPDLTVVDAPDYFNKPGPGLVDGIELLAGILHPEIFPPRKGARRI